MPKTGNAFSFFFFFSCTVIKTAFVKYQKEKKIYNWQNFIINLLLLLGKTYGRDRRRILDLKRKKKCKLIFSHCLDNRAG